MNAPATLDHDDDGERLDPDDEDTGPAVGLRRAEAQWWLLSLIHISEPTRPY